MFENHRKSLIQYCERSYQSSKIVNLATFRKIEACGQAVFPDMSLLIRQKLAKNAKIENSNETFWAIFKHCGGTEFES